MIPYNILSAKKYKSGRIEATVTFITEQGDIPITFHLTHPSHIFVIDSIGVCYPDSLVVVALDLVLHTGELLRAVENVATMEGK